MTRLLKAYSLYTNKSLFAVGGGITLLNGALLPGLSFIIGMYIDALSVSTEAVYITLYLFAGYTVLSVLVSSFSLLIFSSYASKLALKLRAFMLTTLLSLCLEDLESKVVGRVVTSISNDVDVIANVTKDSVPVVAVAALNVVYYVILLFYYNWKYGVVVLGIGIIVFFVALFPQRKAGKLQIQRFNALSSSVSVVPETLNGIKSVKAFSAESDIASRFGEELKKLENVERKVISIQTMSTSVVTLFSTGVCVLVAWLGYYSLSQGENTVGQVSVLVTAVINCNFVIRNLSIRVMDFTRASKAALTFFGTIEGTKYANEGVAENIENLTNFSLEMNAISYKYKNSSQQVLKEVSISIPEGNVVALVGPSGAGKSTIICLLLNFYKNYEGEITFGSVDLKKLPEHTLRSNIGYVPQEPFIFSGTLQDNICIGATEFSLNDVEYAAKLAGIHDAIMELPEGYKTFIKPTTLSGGQKQRVALARALLRKPKLLLLDEPTSALDAIAERQVQETIIGLRKLGISVLILAHRLNTVIKCDNIYVLHSGSVVEQGKFSELMQREGMFASLFKLQQPPKTESIRNRSNTQ